MEGSCKNMFVISWNLLYIMFVARLGLKAFEIQ